MSKENLNPEGDEPKKPLNPEEEESEDEDLEFDEEDFEESDEDEPDVALEAYNAEMQKRGLKSNYKSWDDVAKSAKQRAIKFAKKGMEEKNNEQPVKPEETPVTPTPPTPVVNQPVPSYNMAEELLVMKHPEAALILDDIKKDHPGKDVYEVWKSSTFYQNEAAARAETEKAKQRISNPSGGTEGAPEEDEDSKKFMKNLPPGFKFLPPKK